MSSKIFQTFLLSSLLVACARPNYQNVTSSLTDPNKTSTECSLRLQKLNQCVTLTWIKASTDSEMGIFTLDFSTEQLSEVAVILWMPSMGHGSRPTTVMRLSETQFEVSNVAFIMPGEWEIRIRIKENNQVVDEVAQKFIY